MKQFFLKLIKKIQPFKYFYQKIDFLQKENKKLDMQYKEMERMLQQLKKKNEYIFGVEQRYEKNMNNHYENLKQELHEYKLQVDRRHENVILRIEKNQEAILEKEKQDYTRINKANQQLEKDIKYYYYKGLHPDQYEDNLKEWYYERTGQVLDLEHPVTFNEKVQWLKLHGSTEIKTCLADKYLVRDFVSQKIGEEYLIPILGVYDSFNQINFDTLPDRFVMKTNHASGWNLIVKDKSTLNIQEAKKQFDYWMGRNYAFQSGLELHYKNIIPKIIIEKYIENESDELFDYRFFCFNGKAYSIWIDIDSGKTTHRRNIYDLEWNLLPVKVSYENDEKLNRKPENLKKMIEIAETLSEGIDMVRVDLYEVSGKIYFGEMTFTPQSGQGKWIPEEYNKIYGDMIQLPTTEKEVNIV